MTPAKAFHLSPRKERFRLEYRKDCNAVQAALRAGYAESTANKKAPLWVGPNRDSCPPAYLDLWDAVHEDMKEYAEAATVEASRILQESDTCALVDPILFVNQQTGEPLPLHQVPEAARRALTGFEVVETTVGARTTRRYKYRFDKISAQSLSARARGLGRDDGAQTPGNEGGVVVHMHLGQGRTCPDCPLSRRA